MSADDRPLRLVIFDVDGTLVDSQAHIHAAMQAAFSAFGRACPPREEVLSIVGLSLPQAMGRLAPDLDADENARLVQYYKDSFMTQRSEGDALALSPLYPGARQVIDGLLARNDLLVGLATGKSRRGLDHLLDLHGLTGAFATEQVADHHPSKPNPSMLLSTLSETGCEAADAVMIGDTSFDMEMGRAAQFSTIGACWGYHPEQHLRDSGADVLAQTISEIPALLFEGVEI